LCPFLNEVNTSSVISLGQLSSWPQNLLSLQFSVLMLTSYY